MNYQLLQGDCLEVMAGMPDESVTAIVTDPPYGLTFMSANWDRGVPGVPFWEQALRVAKPGAFLLAFGGDRTHHRLMVAIEDAGWEIRTCIYWVFGSGFPKSLNISAAIDAKLGAEREVIGISPNSRFSENKMFASGNGLRGHSNYQGDLITAPASDAARLFNGYGTALKPAAEIIVVAMKPIDTTFAENALKHGLAGLNIEECRIKPAISDQNGKALAPSTFGNAYSSSPEFLVGCLLRISFALGSYSTADRDHARDTFDLGDNLPFADLSDQTILSHLFPNGSWCGLNLLLPLDYQCDCLACFRLCDEQLRSLQEVCQASAPLLADALVDTCRLLLERQHNHDYQCTCHPSNSGADLLFLSFCQLLLSGLNIDIISYSSPTRKTANAKSDKFSGRYNGGKSGHFRQSVTYTDASPQGRWPANLIHDGSDEVLSCFPNTEPAKAANRGAGINGSTFKSPVYDSSVRGHNDDAGSAARFFYCAKSSSAERSAGVEDGNTHPTLKPISLMRYLCRLVSPPIGGIILDPFMGSGSTGVAALLEGVDFIGIEREAEYIDIARQRLEHYEDERSTEPIKLQGKAADFADLPMFQQE